MIALSLLYLAIGFLFAGAVASQESPAPSYGRCLLFALLWWTFVLMAAGAAVQKHFTQPKGKS